MAGRWRRVFWLFLIFLGLTATVFSNEPAEPGDPDAAREDATGRVVHVIPIVGDIDEGLAAFVERAVGAASREAATAILIEVSTFGGRVDSATAIRDALLAADVPVYAFVNDRAWSAGALITLAAERIAMAPGASMGAAEPRPADEKVISALRKEFEATAERHGRDPIIAAAMVDARVEIEDVVERDAILTLTAGQAMELGFIEVVAMRRAEVLDQLGLAGVRWVEAEPNWAERVARVLSSPAISQILLTIGFLGLLAEVTSPGWGVPGIAGILSLGLFFGARLITGLAGLETVLLFLLGIGLLAVELFVVPGFGLAGLGGIVSITASLFLSFPDFETALTSISISLGATIVVGIFLLRYLPKSRTLERLVLNVALEEAEEDLRPRQEKDRPPINVGALGRTITPLRPAGSIEVDGDRFDAVTEGGFVARGAAVRVIRIEGRRIVVREHVE